MVHTASTIILIIIIRDEAPKSLIPFSIEPGRIAPLLSCSGRAKTYLSWAGIIIYTLIYYINMYSASQLYVLAVSDEHSYSVSVELNKKSTSFVILTRYFMIFIKWFLLNGLWIWLKKNAFVNRQWVHYFPRKNVFDRSLKRKF